MSEVFDLEASLKLDKSGYEDGLSEASSEASGLGSILQSLGGEGAMAFAMIGGAVAGAISAFEGVADVVKETVEYIWEASNATAELGDTIDKMSQKLGLTSEAYQEWDYVLQLNGTSINQMRGGMKTLVNTLDEAKNGSAGAIEKFERLGLSMDEIKDLNQEELFGEVVYALQDMTNETERSAVANDLLGRSAMELAPLLNSTKEETQGLMEQAHEYGFVMSDEMVGASADYEDAMLTMQKTLEGIKNNVFGTLLPSFTDAFTGISQIMAGSTEEGTQKFSDGIKGLATTVATELPKVVETAGTIFMAFGDAIIDSLPIILDSVTSIVSSVARKIPDLLPEIVDAVMQIGSIILQHSDELIEAGGELIKALGDGLIKSLPVIEENLPELIDGMVTAFLTYHDVMMEVGFELLTAIIENMPEIQQICTEATMILIQSIAEYIMSGESTSTMMESGLTLFGAIIDSIAQILGDIILAVEPIVTGIVSKLREGVGKVLTVAGEIMNSFISGIVSFMGNVISTATEIVTNIVTYLMQAPSRVLAIGVSIISSLVSGMGSMIGSVTSTVGNIVNGIISRLQSLPAQMISAGVQAIQGLIQGFASGLDGLMGLVQNTASRMASTLKNALKIHSPSKVFEEIGQFTAEGLGVGWEDEFANVKKSMESDLEFSSNVTTSVKGTSGKTTQPSNDTFVIPIYLNNKVIEEVVIDAQTLYNYRSGGR